MGAGDDLDGCSIVMETTDDSILDDASENAMDTLDDASIDGIKIVRHLSLAYFRKKLIVHFDIMFKRFQLLWPQHRGRLNLCVILFCKILYLAFINES